MILLLCPKKTLSALWILHKDIMLEFFPPSIGVKKETIYKYIKQSVFLVCSLFFVWGVAVLEINDTQIISGKFGPQTKLTS